MHRSILEQNRRAEAHFAATARDFRPFPPALLEQSLPDAWQWAVRRYGPRVAVRGRTTAWTYAELDRHARRVAQAVRARLGADPEPVALLCYHDAPGIAAVWGTLLAGKFYAPLDVSSPPARLQTVLAALEARLLLVERATLPLAAAVGLAADRILVVEDLIAAEDGLAAEDNTAVAPVPGTAPAYIIFTSGTTGAPKGVIETHRNVLRFTHYSIDTWQLSSHDTHLMMTALSFSGTATLLFPPAFSGGTVRCVDLQRDGTGALLTALTAGDLTVASIPPSVLRALPDLLGEIPYVPTLRQVRLGGDTILASDLAVVRQLSPATCVARIGYGMSESKYATHLHADHALELPGPAMPGGFPADYVTVEIHDDDGGVLPAHAPGEIVVYGDYLSPGYWRQPELTAAKYGVDAHGRRYYRTGDLGYLDDEGCLWMLGRRDGQLKIQGQRVETAEVETALAALPGVREAVVVARVRRGEYELVAYVVPEPGAGWEVGGLRRRLGETLPAYMVPAAIGLLDEFPRNSNHKVDRSRLPEIDTLVPRTGTVPMSDLEQEVAGLIAQLLGTQTVDRDANFLDLGGNSLLAARLAAQLRRRFGIDPPVRMILAGATVAELTQTVAEARTGRAAVSPLSLTVQPGRPDRPTLFLCLGGGGSETELMWYGTLLRRLDPDRPIVALLGRGTDGSGPAHPTVDAMVDDYLAEIRGRQPAGPYWLGGECIGAKLAFVLAQRLEEAGESVARLLLLDASPPSPNPVRGVRAGFRRRQQRALYHWDYARRLGLADGVGYLWHRLATRLPGSGWGDPQVRRSLIARAAYRRLLGELRLAGHVHAPTDLIVSDESRRIGIPAEWRQLLAGTVQEATVPGNHRSYLGAHVDTTAGAVRRLLAAEPHPRAVHSP